MKVDVPALTITYLYGTYVDGGGSRTYQNIINPVTWAEDGVDAILTDASNVTVTAFDGSNTEISLVSLPHVTIYSMTKTGDV
jgi:hypothetical protein